MWPSIKPWHDWAMHDLWNLPRSGPQPQALHYSFEKAGLTLTDQPVPWNAEVVLVEALVRRASAPRRKSDFTLHIPGRPPVLADSLRSWGGEENTRVHFRIPPPEKTSSVEVCWRERRLGQMTLPVLGPEDFFRNLRVQLPTFFVRLGEQNVACQTFVSAQCRGLMASAVITNTTSLVPLLDLGLQVELRPDRGPVQMVPARLCSSQLADRQALVAIVPRRFPRRIGAWTVTWLVGDRPLASQKIRAISQRTFQRSLRVSDTRFVVQGPGGEVKVTRQLPPPEQVARVGPCFLVNSNEPGMAGVCTLQTRVQIPDESGSPFAQDHEILITDGPAVVAPGTMAVADLARVSAFELRLKSESLGLLPLSPVPAAAFTPEGGFKAVTDFSWSVNADEELNDRLAKLIDGRGKDE
jgi:hypothetical protein